MKKPNSINLLGNIPTELSRQEVAAILDRLPNLPLPTGNINAHWKTLLTRIAWPFAMVGLCLSLWVWIVPMAKNAPADTVLADKIITAPASSLQEPPATTSTVSVPTQIDAISRDKETASLEHAEAQVALSDLRNPERPLSDPEIQNRDSDSASIDFIEAENKANDVTIIPIKKAKNPRLTRKGNTSRTLAGSTPFMLLSPSSTDRLADVPLRKLRRIIRNNLIRDGLIKSRRDTIDLWLPEGLIFLNNVEMRPDMSLKYITIAEKFGIDIGPYRHIKITYEGIAVGDFTPMGFNGAALGTFPLKTSSDPRVEGLFE